MPSRYFVHSVGMRVRTVRYSPSLCVLGATLCVRVWRGRQPVTVSGLVPIDKVTEQNITSNHENRVQHTYIHTHCHARAHKIQAYTQ